MTMQFLYKGKPVVLESSRAPVQVFKAKSPDVVMVYQDGKYLETLRHYPTNKHFFGWGFPGKSTNSLAQAMLFHILHHHGATMALAQDFAKTVLCEIETCDFQMNATLVDMWIDRHLAELGYDREHLPEDPEGEE